MTDDATQCEHAILSNPDAAGAKVAFRLDAIDWHGSSVETLWAKALPNASESAFQLLNSPFFAKGVSYLDIVSALPRLESAFPEYDKTLQQSGRSTYRILVQPELKGFDQWWQKLADHGCSYESAIVEVSLGTRLLYAVDVPATCDIYMVYSVFQQGEDRGIWVFEEGHVGHDVRR